MNRTVTLLLLATSAGAAAPGSPTEREIGLRGAIRLALEQNPKIRIARLEARQAGLDLAILRSERSTQLFAGSGLGATSGIPQSIHGAAPSVAQVTLRQSLLDAGRPRREDAARARQRAREHSADAAAEESAYRAGVLFLDLALLTRQAGRLGADVQQFERIERVVSARVEEGAEIPLALSRAGLDLARAREHHQGAQAKAELLEAELRGMLGLGPDVRLSPDPASDGVAAGLARIAAERIRRPLEEHPAMESLAADALAARHRAREAQASRLPALDVVGQYSLLARLNNYDDYFRRFQRHNWQAGVAFRVPILSGRGTSERIAKARLEEREIELRREARRSELELAGIRADAALNAARRRAELARLELDFARENVGVLLAQFQEGRVALGDLERARVMESSAWGVLYESQCELAKAQLGVIYSAGGIRDAFAD